LVRRVLTNPLPYNPEERGEGGVTFTIGWWGIPAAVTVMSFGWVIIAGIREPHSSGYGAGIVGMFFSAAAAIVSLSAWLAWAVLT
jgi:hypothetical protein